MTNLYKQCLAIFICAIATLPLQAQQIQQVFIDNSKRTFNEGNPLPAATYFQVTGGIPQDVSLVKLSIFSKSNDKSPIYSNYWKRHFSDNSTSFYIPVDEKLQPNNSYTLKLTYLRTLDETSIQSFREKIHSNLEAYVKAVTVNTSSNIELNGSVDQNMNRLNRVMRDGFKYHESLRGERFPGFSDLVRLKLEQVRNAGLQNARYNVKTDTLATDVSAAQQYSSKLQQELTAQLKNEADNFLAAGVRTVYDELEFNDYPTEKRKSFLPLNIGYGAVYLGGSTNDLEYDSQPYAGVSIPLGNPRMRKFLGNASISFGIFLRDFENKQGNKLTGPLINKPFYLGLGYKIFDFLKFNAGAVALSEERLDLDNFRTEEVTIRPFVGLAAEFNIFFGNSR